ncbi:delta1-piperideine-2-carboxylate reductase [Agrobacterium larrymoorei]|uniref:Delta(1)-pyrroline-2-carboxylate/Delta(1)-piperideine-2-carboxylate reductase n=1 Tax=Agrobacterium larrymoorei TaxID=160699 RepID=A0AAJ2B7X8_9HYPH|nr:Ldh family oxidoreductase [Agrobacterium larrymoorei]MDR6100919.1 delta1-piperideine-2-carboxylate reductase [Agrobacterium larrymoorei]
MTINSFYASEGEPSESKVTTDYDTLRELLRSIFIRVGASSAVAALLSSNCANCERDGALSHGIFRIPGYVSSIRSGWVDPSAVPSMEDVAEAFLRVDAMNGFAQPALAAASTLLIEKARRNGIAIAAIRNSHHFSALWPDVEPFAEMGLLAVSMVNSFACTVPFDGKKPTFGTNPIAFAAPRGAGSPLVADLATSAIANGDVQIAARQGFTLPPGYGVDRDGKATTDPNRVLDGGALLTFGGYKGSAVSMMIELFAAALTGGKFSYEVDWSDHPGAQTPHTGQVVIVIDPDCGRKTVFAQRVNALTERLMKVGVSRLPGDRRHTSRALSIKNGILLQLADWQRLNDMANQG